MHVVVDVEHHDPVPAGLVPEHLRVAVAAVDVADDRVAVVGAPGAPPVGAVDDADVHRPAVRQPVGAAVGGVEDHHRRAAGAAQAGRVVVVDHARAGHGHAPLVGPERVGKLLPRHQVAADRVAPAPVAVGVAGRDVARHVLVVQVPLPVEPDQAVGVRGRAAARRVVEQRPAGLPVQVVAADHPVADAHGRQQIGGRRRARGVELLDAQCEVHALPGRQVDRDPEVRIVVRQAHGVGRDRPTSAGDLYLPKG